jgi:hypothetical protein
MITDEHIDLTSGTFLNHFKPIYLGGANEAGK